MVQFFAVSVHLFASQKGSDSKIDNPYLRKCLGPILELVCRTYTDDQMEQRVKDISTELVDQFSGSLEKTFFITEFNRVQQSITRNRMERKMKSRLLAGTQEGQ
jgi:AraC-like DNA-binding protein